MNSSGMAFQDIGFLSVYLYFFFGGWLLTAVGVVLSLRVPAARFELAAVTVALPIFYLMFLWVGGMFHSGTSEALETALMTGSAISVLAGPIAATIMLVRNLRRPPPGNGVNAHS